MLAGYGVALGSPRKLPYEQYVGLYLNLERQRLRLAWAIQEGVKLAIGKGPRPKGVVEAVYDTQQEAADVHRKLERERRIQEAMKRHGWSN